MKRFIAAALFCFSYVISFSQNFNIAFRSNLPYPGQTLANIWGHVDSLGNEYALCGASNGLSIVNVANPDLPFQVAQVSGPNSLWKEVKTHGKYAYVTTEGGGGLQIIDLRLLPGTTLPSKFWAPDISGTVMSKIHALHIDNGFAYLYGGDLSGVVIADLSDPWNPTVAGVWNQTYIHDGYVRNNTLYAGQIYQGQVGIINVSDKANPVLEQSQSTPGNFTHNTWLSDDSKTLFTTDEVSNSFLTSYDITDINNITELDRLQATPGSGSIVHNTHILNDWAVTSWYKDGVNIVDAHRPQNLVQVGIYDTYSGVGNGFDGTWGVYPFLPSGNLIVSNIDEGLFILSPTYVRACYLEGIVTDSLCGSALNNVTVEIVASNFSDVTNITNLSGSYKTGYHIPGTYNVTFSKPGYTTRTITGVLLTAGNITNLDIKLYSSITVNVTGAIADSISTLPVIGVPVVLSNSSNTYNFITDGSGSFNSCNVVADTYSLSVGAWGYNTICKTQVVSTGVSSINEKLFPGYMDDFNFDFGWSVSGNATAGIWERGIPVGTDFMGTGNSNPGIDVSSDCGDEAFITGNGGGAAGTDDLDNGSTVLTSPVFDLTSYINPAVNYSRWFFNAGGSGGPNDSLIIKLSNGISTVTLETVLNNSPGNSSWVPKSFIVSDYLVPTNNMRLIAYAADAAPGHLVEAGLDHFFIFEASLTAVSDLVAKANDIKVSPNPFYSSVNIEYNIESSSDKSELVISDITGRVIQTIPVSQKGAITLEGESLSKGIYFIRIVSKNTVSSPVRIVKL